MSAHPIYAGDEAVDGNAYLGWWSNNVSADPVDTSFDVGSFGGDAEVWWRHRWGLRGSLYKSDVAEAGSPSGSDFLSFDFTRRILSPVGNNFLALGLGWENIDVAKRLETSGPRLLLQGNLGLTPLWSLYGHTAWLPSLASSEQLQDPDGLELEAGISVRPFPNFSFRAGYREFRLDFKSLEGANESSRSKGVVFGAGVNF